MPTSLFAADAQAILDVATQKADQAGGPFPSPSDWRDVPIYFLMVDRFNRPNGGLQQPPFDNPNFVGFQGGKFSGIQQKLNYIRGLGVKGIWLSPVLKNLPFLDGTYHGYGIHDFLRAEPRFADQSGKADDELRALVDAAHQAGLYVIFDIVLNHVGDVFGYQSGNSAFHDTAQPIQWRDDTGKARPDFPLIENIANPSADSLVWPSELQQNRFFRRQGNPQSNGDDTVGDFDSLKQMLTSDPNLQGFLIRAYQYVIARFDVDGFRIDTLRYLKGDLARLFGNSIREFALSIGKRNFFTFGEVLDSNVETDIARFIGRATSDASELVGVDAALDYPLFNNLKSVTKGLAPPSDIVGMFHRRKEIEADILSSHGDATRFFVTFLDNHDQHERIRFVQPGDEHRFDDQVTLGIACLMSLPGIPCIYYGTEQGLHGRGSDEAVREALWGTPGGFDTKIDFYVDIQAIAAVRAAQPALRYGRFYFRPVSGDDVNFGISAFQGGILAFSRILNDQEVLVVANTNSTQSQSVNVIVEIALSTPGVPFRILYSNQTAPTPPSNVSSKTGVSVREVDGSLSGGPIHKIAVTLLPMEVQILRQ
jgi:glycosidase